MTTDGLPERPEFESQSTERILRRISEVIFVSADTTRQAQEAAAFASRQEFIQQQVNFADAVPDDPFAGPTPLPGDGPFDNGNQDPKPNESPEPARGGDPAPDPFADPGPQVDVRNDPFAGEPAIPGDHPFDPDLPEQKPDFAMLAEAPPLPDSLDPMVAGALQFQNSEFVGNEEDREPELNAEPDAPEAPSPDFPKPQANQQQRNADDFTNFTFEGVESSFGGRRANRQPPPPVDMPEDPMQVGEQTTLFHEDDSTILQMVQQYREADQQFRKGVMDIFERIIMDLHADNARLMSIARHFQQSRRSTR